MLQYFHVRIKFPRFQIGKQFFKEIKFYWIEEITYMYPCLFQHYLILRLGKEGVLKTLYYVVHRYIYIYSMCRNCVVFTKNCQHDKNFNWAFDFDVRPAVIARKRLALFADEAFCTHPTPCLLFALVWKTNRELPQEKPGSPPTDTCIA